MSYIVCKDLTLGYDGCAVANHISFEVGKQDYLYILGENGVGKSTLMKTILQLIEPMGGSITRGDDLKAYEIGYLPQQTLVQRDFPASVWEIVLSGTLAKCGFRPFYTAKEKKCAEQNMKKMAIWELRKKCYRDLSGGQQQRVLLARALCATTKLLVLDEPVTGLDPKVTVEFYELLKMLHQEGIAIIMISHDIHAAMQYATHILHVDKENSFFGTREEYCESAMRKEFGVED